MFKNLTVLELILQVVQGTFITLKELNLPSLKYFVFRLPFNPNDFFLSMADVDWSELRSLETHLYASEVDKICEFFSKPGKKIQSLNVKLMNFTKENIYTLYRELDKLTFLTSFHQSFGYSPHNDQVVTYKDVVDILKTFRFKKLQPSWN